MIVGDFVYLNTVALAIVCYVQSDRYIIFYLCDLNWNSIVEAIRIGGSEG